MPNPARRAVALAVLAAAIVAAAVALDLPSVAAQSDEQSNATMQTEEQSYGKINARRAADDRIEFGWQPTDASGTAIGPRVFPRARFLPQHAQIARWLHSSPVEVDGAAIGRINARMLEGGRIEFGFTPTDGERILPPSRYFPHNATRGRWLSSTTIAVGQTVPPVSSNAFTAVSAGGLHTCGLRESGAIECWGGNWSGQADAPAGRFTAVSAGNYHTCAIYEGGAITCWGDNDKAQASTIPGTFTAISAGHEHTCGLRTNREIMCWGFDLYGENRAPAGPFSAVSAGHNVSCGLRSNGSIVCWGQELYGLIRTPPDTVTAIAAGIGPQICGLRTNGQLVCWGRTWGTPLAGRFMAVSTGKIHTCGLRDTGAILCWGGGVGPGGEYAGQTDAPDGRFTAVSAGGSHSCGLRESGAIECWGSNSVGQSDAPAP